jgi:hypothetical protein
LCQFFNAGLDEDICHEIEGHLFKLILSPSEGAAVSEIPSHNYCAPSSEKGVTILLGGDHGDQYFGFHEKIQLTFPIERKKRRDLSYDFLQPSWEWRVAKHTTVSCALRVQF